MGKGLDNFLITRSNLDKNVIFVISATSSIEIAIRDQTHRQKIFFDS